MSATPNTTKSSDSTDEEASTKETLKEISDDKIFHLLQVKRRRDVLRYLQDHGGSAEMRDVTEQVAAWENNTTLAELSSNERQRVYISLYQSHLPKLDKEGVIEYDQSRGNVKLTPLAEQLKPYLDAAVNDTVETTDDSVISNTDEQASSESTPWLKAYQYLTVVGLTVLLGFWANISLFTVVGIQQWAAVIVALFGILSAAQILLAQD
ncbi:DUF7344 domain-containing protein [Halomicrococcus sp. NG-SE-24]|uniref:DUF7344 domain-containing protein n=1 Tax=Halomicrococcus sp. NG-SE-24 TaxID=3436928 RepID=UPI003D994995